MATPLLETTLNKFPQGTEDFVSHSVLKDYIQDTAIKTEVDAITKYNTEVQNVVKTGNKWVVRTAKLRTTDTGALSQEILTTVSVHSYSKKKTPRPLTSPQNFDAVVVASGHYHSPRVPDIPGLAEWKRLYPDRIQHSKGYRSPKDYQGKVTFPPASIISCQHALT